MRMLVFVFVAFMVSLVAQTAVYEFNGVLYTFPASHVAASLTNDGGGTLTWATGTPSGLLAWTKNGTCPSGWSEYTAARGRAVVGMTTGFTLNGTVGTALTNTEARAVGQHTHTATPSITLSNPTHDHGITDPGHTHTVNDPGELFANSGPSGGAAGTGDTGSATTGITINVSASGAGVTGSATTTVNNEGTTAGTNAPYVQLMLCQKT